MVHFKNSKRSGNCFVAWFNKEESENYLKICYLANLTKQEFIELCVRSEVGSLIAQGILEDFKGLKAFLKGKEYKSLEEQYSKLPELLNLNKEK